MRPVAGGDGRRTGTAVFVALFLLALTVPSALAAGSATLYPSGVAGTRANSEGPA